jgi:hypothetical protein
MSNREFEVAFSLDRFVHGEAALFFRDGGITHL